MSSGLFIPGWAATAGMYARGLPHGWEALEPPTFRTAGGELVAYRRWLCSELDRRAGPFTLAGHSMGGALALLAAIDRPAAVERLILLGPAGLPLDKPIAASAATFAGQVLHRRYPAGELARALLGAFTSPRRALRLAHALHDLDLAAQLEPIRVRRLACTVIGCASDRLTTPAHCRRLASLLDARYREIESSAGHIWMIAEPSRLARELHP